MTESPAPKRFRQLILDMGGADDQIVRRGLCSWRRARVVPVPEITGDECRARAFAQTSKRQPGSQKKDKNLHIENFKSTKPFVKGSVASLLTAGALVGLFWLARRQIAFAGR